MDVPIPYIINDTRKQDDFRIKTYSGYKKQDVLNVIFKKIEEGKPIEVCEWLTEIVCSGYIEDLWEKIILYYAKFINIHSPYLPYYLYKKLILFLKVKGDDYFTKHELDMRNSQEVRNQLTELVCILTNTTKARKGLTLNKIKPDEFQPNFFQNKLLAKDFSVSLAILENNDPEELTFLTNEFAYHLEYNHYNLQYAIYWLSWILEWEKLNLLKRGKYECSFRDVGTTMDKKYKTDFIWIFWDIILREGQKRHSKDLSNQIKSMYEFFKYKYTSSKKKKRIHIMLTCIQLLNPEFTFDKYMRERYPVFEKYHIIVQASSNINVLFQRLKQDENLQNSIINSRIKMAATNVVTKYEDLKSLNDISQQRLKEKEKKKLEKELNNKKKKLQEKKNKNKEEKEAQRNNILNTIDSHILNTSNSRPRNFTYTSYKDESKEINNSYDTSKIVNVIDEIDKKLEKRGKNKKNKKELNVINLNKLD